MGMTKAIQEKTFIAANITNPNTRFICTRYGNVMASRGSVIPLFHEQIRTGNDITLTDPRMTRFLLNLDQAVDLIFAAIKEANVGEIYVPRAPSATVETIAKAIIGDRKVNIKTIGIRPGEKLDEIMISDEESSYVDVRQEKYYAILPMLPELKRVDKKSVLHKEYSSGDVLLSLDDTKQLLHDNKLLYSEDVKLAEGEELLR
jgi:UDP-glucose 4-epimerase